MDTNLIDCFAINSSKFVPYPLYHLKLKNIIIYMLSLKTIQNHPGVWGDELATWLTAGRLIDVIANCPSRVGASRGGKHPKTSLVTFLVTYLALRRKAGKKVTPSGASRTVQYG